MCPNSGLVTEQLGHSAAVWTAWARTSRPEPGHGLSYADNLPGAGGRARWGVQPLPTVSSSPPSPQQ